MAEQETQDVSAEAKISDTDKKTIKFFDNRKKAMKNSRYRRSFDNMKKEIDSELVDTNPNKTRLDNNMGATWAFASSYSDGQWNFFPILRSQQEDNTTRVPEFREPNVFSKILIAASVLGTKIPDGYFKGDDKIYARAQYELWKKTWENPFGNGSNTLVLFYQFMLTYGWAAYRVYPKTVPQKTKKKDIERILFDDIYREPLDPARTWLGTGVNVGDMWSWGEVLYEKDMLLEDFKREHPDATKSQLKLTGLTQEAKDEDPEKTSSADGQTFVTIEYYENELENRYIVKSGSYVINDGELPNDDGFGTIVWANCFKKDLYNPYGIGLWELMRGNDALYQYIKTLTAKQVEAEVYPLLFGANVGNGEMTYRRGPNIINPKIAGDEITTVRTTGNVPGAQAFADRQKNIMAENTGVTEILAGEGGANTLGETVLMQEASLKRLTIPRNNVVQALQRDAYMAISWIKQTYPYEKVYEFDSDEQIFDFAQANPGYFIEKRDFQGKKYALVSKDLEMSFDFDENEEIIEREEPYRISAPALFDSLKGREMMSDRLVVQIDPNSMLEPSQEVKKQQTLEVYQIVGPKTMEIIAMAQQSPDTAQTLLKQLERVLEVQNETLYNWIPKNIVDRIKRGEAVPPVPPEEGGGVPTSGQGQPGGVTNRRATTPEETPRASNGMRDAMNASTTRAARGNFVPQE